MDIRDVTEQLEKIVQQLDNLDKLSADFYNQYDGDAFPDQRQLAGKLDDLLLAATHETASNLFFLKEKIRDTASYIGFRKKYSFLSENDLKQIIDCHHSNVKLKLELKYKLADMDYMKVYGMVKQEWKMLFGNADFEKKTSLLNR